MKYTGLFFVRNRRALQGLIDAPYHILGRHALCAQNTATDGGAIACAVGRLRNGDTLREQIKDAGLTLNEPHNLSELTLQAYRLWGHDYPRHLSGPIATALIDQDAQALVLSRDPMGELPMFYTYKAGSIAFSDHPAALLDSGIASRVVDQDGLCELFGLGPARTPGLTPFRDIRSLEPGTSLIADSHTHRLVRFFELEAHEHEDSEIQTIQTVRNLVEQSVADIAPLHPASMLSGGLDSTVLTALLKKQTRKTIDTWSVDYEDSARYFSGNNFQIERDTPFIERAVELFGTNHHMVTLNADQLAGGLMEAMRQRAMPGMGDIDSSLMLFAREIGKEHEYVVSGECGDEVFGGYPWFNREEMILSESFPWSGSIALRESVLKKGVREKLHLSRYVCTRYHESACGLPRLVSDSLREARLRQLHGLCFSWFMPNLQERAQRMCSASNLTVLTPFSDERLVQYLYNVPWEMKSMRGSEKGLLRVAMQDLLPDDLLWRKKSPYPKTHHPAYAQLMREQMSAILRDPSSPILDLIDVNAVQALIDSPLKPADTPWFGQLMAGAQMLAYLIQVNGWLLEYRVEVDI
ncbi:asparagine synthetase B [Eubacteriales bacterium OttesenSCG-928-N13]|nr:asparagine synthetase B [Eubacteriales bacterium OttesenSCG-928-N13]